MATYPAYVWDGSAWQPVGSQVADMSPYALKDGSNMAGYGAWSSYTPTLTWTGSSWTWTTTGRYIVFGKTCHFWARAIISGGSAGSPSVQPSMSVPLTMYDSVSALDFKVTLLDSGAAWYTAMTAANNTTSAYIFALGANGIGSGTTSTYPFTWAVNDAFYMHGKYEVA